MKADVGKEVISGSRESGPLARIGYAPVASWATPR